MFENHFFQVLGDFSLLVSIEIIALILILAIKNRAVGLFLLIAVDCGLASKAH